MSNKNDFDPLAFLVGAAIGYHHEEKKYRDNWDDDGFSDFVGVVGTIVIVLILIGAGCVWLSTYNTL